jgi:hypothetical protein
MTGVGDSPRTLDEHLRAQNRKIVALERQLRRAGALDLSGRIVGGEGISLEGTGAAGSPVIINATHLQRGTGVERAATPSVYWDFWQDTDGTGQLYVGNKSGGWRLFSGRYAEPSAVAWSGTGSGGTMAAAWRTTSYVLPTVLETNEWLMVTSTTVGSGYGSIAPAGLLRDPTDTTLTLRVTQLQSAAQQAISFVWQIVQA